MADSARADTAISAKAHENESKANGEVNKPGQDRQVTFQEPVEEEEHDDEDDGYEHDYEQDYEGYYNEVCVINIT